MFHRVWQTFHQKTVPKASYNLDTFFARALSPARCGAATAPQQGRAKGTRLRRRAPSLSAKTCHAKITA